MPIFEFVCSSCYHEFEELVFSSNGGYHVTCPSCGEENVEKQISTFASKVAGSSSYSSNSSGASCSTGST